MTRHVAAAASAPAAWAGPVVVTGAARAGQLGMAIARSFAEHGAHVAIVARTLDDARARAAELRAEGLVVSPFDCDLSDPSATATLAATINSEIGDAAALVNAAGGFAFSGPVADADPLIPAAQFTISALTAYNATKSFLPALRKTRGSIVFIASAAVLPGGRVKGVSGYAMAKAGVLALMHAVAQEEAANGVRSNAIAPGAVRTSSNVESMSPSTRYVEPESVSAVIRFLCSPDAANVTGQVIEVAP